LGRNGRELNQLKWKIHENKPVIGFMVFRSYEVNNCLGDRGRFEREMGKKVRERKYGSEKERRAWAGKSGIMVEIKKGVIVEQKWE
jgi:hypothetical protein